MRLRPDRALLTAFLAVYGVACLASPKTWRLLDAVNLAIHETGHIVFTPFGQVMHFLGGSLLQLLIPLAFVASFLRRGDRHAASVCLWWVAQNCWNISVYVADARARELPLVGGSVHDWWWLLRRAGWLSLDQQLARSVHFAGVVLFVAAIAWGLSTLRERESDPLESEDAALREWIGHGQPSGVAERPDRGVTGSTERAGRHGQ